MAAKKGVFCILSAMDHLWFHQTILLSEPSVIPLVGIPKTPLPTSESDLISSIDKIQDLSEQETSPASSLFSSSQEEGSSQESDNEERPTRINIVSSKARSRSSSPILVKKQKNKRIQRHSRLQKSSSCKSLGELELEEVKGFMDLGFVFKKDNLSEKMMSLIPGLQRLEACENDEKDNSRDQFEINDDYEEEKEEIIMRPYLSEAWVVKKPNSPLLNLRFRRVTNNSMDMKRHLKDWARTVAFVVQQES